MIHLGNLANVHSRKSFEKESSLRRVVKSSIFLGILLGDVGKTNAGCEINPDSNGNVEIPASTTAIIAGAYNGCASLKTITFGAGTVQLTSIDNYAFHQSGLTSFAVPASVNAIGDNAFYECTSLATFTFDANSLLATMGANVLKGSIISSIAIPSGVPSIGDYAFYQCTNLASVTFQSNSELVSIGENSFSHSGITSFVVPDKVTSIGANAFAVTSSLSAFSAGCSSAVTLETNCFLNSAISSINLPDAATCTSCVANSVSVVSITACDPPTAAPTAESSDTGVIVGGIAGGILTLLLLYFLYTHFNKPAFDKVAGAAAAASETHPESA